jgi:putative hemolysin
MIGLRKGRYRARLAESDIDRAASFALRALAFRDDATADDTDRFDPMCHHIVVEEIRTGTIVCCLRLLPLTGGAEIDQCYSAQFYELSALQAFDAPMVEMGRFCIHPAYRDPDILRVAWGAMTRYVDDTGVEMLFGCSSFKGTEADSYMDAFALLRDKHLAPKRWLPRVKAQNVFQFGRRLGRTDPNRRTAMQGMPPLLRTYLMMGGWVSDHAVVDPDLNTLHVFTGLEISAIPPARARFLRGMAG